MKELPKEFQFKCDEHSKEYCEKLGIDALEGNLDKLILTYYGVVIGKTILELNKDIFNPHKYPIISLSDYMEEETTGTIKLANDGSVFYGTTNQNPKLEFRSGNTTYIHPDAVQLPHIVKPATSTPDHSELIVEMTKANVKTMYNKDWNNGYLVNKAINLAEETIKQLKERGYLK